MFGMMTGVLCNALDREAIRGRSVVCIWLVSCLRCRSGCAMLHRHTLHNSII